MYKRERPERPSSLSALIVSECSFSPEINWLPFSFFEQSFLEEQFFEINLRNSFFSHNRHRILLFIKHLTHEYRYRHLKLRILYADTYKKRTEESRAFESSTFAPF